jgi:hypothetical protein
VRYFACRTKNGEDVKADGKRITISEDGQLYMLVIRNVTREDAGIFAAEVRLRKNRFSEMCTFSCQGLL